MTSFCWMKAKRKMEKRSEELYALMIRKGYPSEFAGLVSEQMHTEYTSQRMIAYVSRAGLVPPQEFADEMLRSWRSGTGPGASTSRNTPRRR